MTVRRGYLTVDHGRLHYRAAGERGERILLLHQTPLSSDIYSEVLVTLGERFQAVAVDSPGFGESDPPPHQWGIADYAAAIVQGMDALGWESANLVGRLTGSTVACEVAAQAHGRISRLILSAMPDYDDETRIEKLNNLNPMVLRPDASQATTAWARLSAMNPALPADKLHRLVVAMLKSGPRGEEAHHAVFSYDPKPRFGHISAPTLLLYGELDRFQDRIERIQPLIPHCSVRRIPGGGPGETLTMIDPGPFLEAVTDFFG